MCAQKDAWRVTLTWPVINRAQDVFFLIEGADKVDALKQVFPGPYDPESFPSQLIRPASRRITLFLDAAAAAALPPPGLESTREAGDRAMILAGDVGGTKVDLALCKFERGQLLTVHEHKFHAKEFSGLEQVVDAFLEDCKQSLGQPFDVLAACFGVPGPVRHGRLKLTNLPWELDASQLASI